MDSSSLNKERTVRLFHYLKELSLLKAPLILDLQQYENTLWIGDIPDEPECLSPINHTGVKDKWVEVKKPTTPIFPCPPASISAWIETTIKIDNPKNEPKLREMIPNPDSENAESEEPQYLHLKDYPEITSNFDLYIKDKWQPWQSEAIRVERIQEVYEKLFTIYQKQKKLGEQFELVIGVGLLNWQTTNANKVHRHLVTVPCTFQFDSNNGVIRVIPPAEGIKPEIEQDMLELEDRLDNKALEPINEKMNTLHEDLWNKELLDTILRSFVQSVSASGYYDEDVLHSVRNASKDPAVSFSPALILRKRNEKGFQQACSTIIENTSNGTMDIPLGIARIFNEIDDYQDGESRSSSQTADLSDSEIYFPLEANDEQQRIVTNLETRNGVLVQGPPGTGKSHTIANLTSHLLATGKRVLITSQTPRALKVLKDKIPVELQALCVSLLGADSKSFKDLESVVQVISNRRDSWNPDITSKKINDLSTDLKIRKEKDALYKQKLRSIREQETYEHNFLDGRYKGTAQTIANKLNSEKSKYHWLMDRMEMTTPLPLTNSEALELVALLNELDKDIQEQIQLSIPASDLLLEVSEFKNLVQKEMDLQNQIQLFDPPIQEGLDLFLDISAGQRSNLKKLLLNLRQSFVSIDELNEEWVNKAKLDLLGGKFPPWEEFYKQVMMYVDSIKDLAQIHNLVEISGQGNVPLIQLNSDVTLLKQHLVSGNGFGVPLMRPKVVKDAWYIIKDVRIDGRKCDQLESITLLEETVKVDVTIKKAEQMIAEQLHIQSIDKVSTSRTMKIAQLQNILEPFTLLFTMQDLIEKITETNEKGIVSVHNLSTDQVTLLLSQLDFLEIKEELTGIEHSFMKLIHNIESSIDLNSQHPITPALIQAIKSRDIAGYVSAGVVISNLDEYSRKLERCEIYMHKLKKVMPKLYSQLTHKFDFQEYLKKFKHFEEAVQWAKVDKWFHDFSQTSESTLKKELEENNRFMKQITAELGAFKAWYSTLSTLTEGQRQHLLAWTTSMRKVGKGTGKNAPIHLRDAQYHMSYCRDAIPAWIMPLYRIFETFEIKPNLFDVVIIDEASQSGPEAVILQYIAKKLIVVGDDKQISPEYVGIKREEIQFLRKQYLYDFKLADLLDIENSFFDLANVLFGGRITLREHFRCMPEIIQFSNRISYTHTPLIPLREYPPNRLEPIKTRHIPNGHREGSSQKVVNRPEAEAVVAEIKDCIENPLYKGKSMGVISLQNEGQAQLIEKKLLQEIGPEEMEKRNLICGDAYAFQGDERDIMFLSMVAAPGETAMKALTTEKDKRRFNVAVSRAKDQLWLFHTPTVNDLRNKDDMRYQLISYCENPEREIHTTNREKCESDFERVVYDQITAKGYRVIPQFEVAGYRIDLVVEGVKGRIAVECDGDYWHGPERYDYDMNRQRILERCGWRFWRVRGSEYYYNPEKALDSLWDTLKQYQIEPSGKIDLNRPPKTMTISLTRKNEVQDVPGDKAELGQKSKEINQPITQATGEDHLIQSTVHTKVETLITDTKEVVNQKHLTIAEAGLKAYLENLGYEVIDQRDHYGAFWLVGDMELNELITKLKEQNIHFSYAPNGSIYTNRRPGWYTNYQG
ncbi:AAA domain-containing protein [Neobacillus sp. MER 74]|uniref:AAA domain-containing protein n=1 Tax=Neobacillus sp. MER 74 TaxID=2939566 RepID=UPI00203D6BCB|nr:AAA domain-containing protein [Neobacillus sp. MER 74]MCM3117820.1 AAA domain-containing protein [Neobacillus sp. MER 74]